MKELHKTSFLESLLIQKRVVGALLMREIITRYGRDSIGFLWLFAEPSLLTLVMVLMWKFFRMHNVSALNIVALTLTGYPMMIMWHNASNRSIGSVSANTSLLYHRNVRVLNTIFTRMLLEIVGATIAQVVIMFALVIIGRIDVPADIFYMLLAWLLMAVFVVGLGLVTCSVVFHFEPFGKVRSTISFAMMPLSDVFFFVRNLPQQLQHYVLMLPMVHGIEMFRAGYFGDSVTTYESPWYILLCNLVLLPLGLAMVVRFSKGVEPQ